MWEVVSTAAARTMDWKPCVPGHFGHHTKTPLSGLEEGWQDLTLSFVLPGETVGTETRLESMHFTYDALKFKAHSTF